MVLAGHGEKDAVGEQGNVVVNYTLEDQHRQKIFHVAASASAKKNILHRQACQLAAAACGGQFYLQRGLSTGGKPAVPGRLATVGTTDGNKVTMKMGFEIRSEVQTQSYSHYRVNPKNLVSSVYDRMKFKGVGSMWNLIVVLRGRLTFATFPVAVRIVHLLRRLVSLPWLGITMVTGDITAAKVITSPPSPYSASQLSWATTGKWEGPPLLLSPFIQTHTLFKTLPPTMMYLECSCHTLPFILPAFYISAHSNSVDDRPKLTLMPQGQNIYAAAHTTHNSAAFQMSKDVLGSPPPPLPNTCCARVRPSQRRDSFSAARGRAKLAPRSMLGPAQRAAWSTITWSPLLLALVRSVLQSRSFHVALRPAAAERCRVKAFAGAAEGINSLNYDQMIKKGLVGGFCPPVLQRGSKKFCELPKMKLIECDSNHLERPVVVRPVCSGEDKVGRGEEESALANRKLRFRPRKHASFVQRSDFDESQSFDFGGGEGIRSGIDVASSESTWTTELGGGLEQHRSCQFGSRRATEVGIEHHGIEKLRHKESKTKHMLTVDSLLCCAENVPLLYIARLCQQVEAPAYWATHELLDRPLHEFRGNTDECYIKDVGIEVMNLGKRASQPQEDFQEQKLHEPGISYVGWSREGKKRKKSASRGERKMGPPCNSAMCKISKVRECTKLLHEDRQKLFQLFWEEMNWDQIKVYIVSLINKTTTKRCTKTSSEQSLRAAILTYTIKTADGHILTECKNKLFYQLLDVKNGQYGIGENNGICQSRTVINYKTINIPLNATTSARPVTGKDILCTFIDYAPKLPSHYCRRSTTKPYIEPIYGDNVSGLYREYSKQCKEKHYLFTFENVVHDKNIGLQIPNKDRCDTCIAYETKHIDEITYRNHIKNKESADSVHSHIERKVKNKAIHLPSDYARLTREARKDPPYEVNELSWHHPSKLNFDSEYMDLPHRTSRNEAGNLCDFPQLRNEPIKIKYRKWQHLQELKKVITMYCGPFYDSQPHEVKPAKAIMETRGLKLGRWTILSLIKRRALTGRRFKADELTILVECCFLAAVMSVALSKQLWLAVVIDDELTFLVECFCGLTAVDEGDDRWEKAVSDDRYAGVGVADS
ncbi:hypothetical protein PR048_013716 [Dryococelus australis]|uniref:Uncharacterized protein n=1 Tax=Dryococelus australis TaxID=614101 RepID=A0ABQ9HT37_9NEOP|nr:hypothetical protein PR048_013716 [Dryococelus australis]